MLVDSHCHLNFPDFREDLEAVIMRAREAGVKVMQTICTEMAEFEEVLAIAERYENIFCSVGVHPNDSGKTDIVSVELLKEKTSHEKVIGIGETGLDYHYETSDRVSQQTSFRHHITCARETGLPIIVHTRDAEKDTVSILREEMNKGAFGGVIHCFTSSNWLADQALEMGFYISISGIATFRNAQNIRDTIKTIPMERLLIETDAPFLAPAPHRGKRNEPSFVTYTNRLVAEIKDISEDNCATITTENFFKLFTKASAVKEVAEWQ